MAVKLDLSKFKKVSSDKHHTMLKHDDGHEIKIAHGALSRENQSALKKLPMVKDMAMNSGAASQSMPMAQGGQAEDPTQRHLLPGDKVPNQIEKDYTDRIKHDFGGVRAAEGGEISDEALISKKKEIDDYNKTHEDEPKPYSQDIESKMQKTDVTPEQYADGGDVADESSSEDDSEQSAPTQAPVIINNNPAPSQPSGSLDQAQSQMNQLSQAPGTGAPPVNPQQAPQDQQPAAPNVPSPDLASGYANKQQGIQQESVAQQALGQAQTQAFESQAKAQAKMALDYQDHFNQLDQERKNFQDDILNNHIDPNHYLGSKDTGQKILMGLGLVLGGFGGGIHGNNQALSFLNQQIDRDIDAQKADLGKRQTLLSENMRQFGNLHDATAMTKVMMNDMMTTKLAQTAAKASSPLAASRALQASGDLQMQVAPSMQQMAMRRALQGAGGTPGLPGGQAIKADPASFVTSMVPPDKQKEVFGQIEAAQDTKRMAGSIMNAFDQATKENTVFKTGAGLLRTPASVYALHQALQPTFKDLEGTVRQAAMDNTFKNITPAPGDSQHTLDTKRTSLMQYLQSKASAPMAKGYGIDLTKFESTVPQSETKTFNGVQYQKVQGGWKKVQ